MKKTISILLFILAINLNTLNAQEKPSREKIEALKIAFITEKLSLTEKQAQQFWPMYNSLQSEKNVIRKGLNISDRNTKPKIEDLTDAELKSLVQAKFESQEKILLLEKNYFQKYQSVLSMKQIALLYQAEKDFRKEILERIRQKK